MPVIELSDAIVDKARHALGLTRQKVAYRNYYTVTEPDPDWEDLVARGYATARRMADDDQQHVCIHYSLTKEAKFFFLNHGESIE